MKKIIALILCISLLCCFAACGNTDENNATESDATQSDATPTSAEQVTFDNGVTKLAENLYTVTVTDEYDVHCMEEYLRENYWVQEYADYYENQYADVVAEALKSDGAACSGARNGNIVGRTYDWYYTDSPAVIVKTTATENRLASISCFSGVKNTEQVENEEVGVIYSLIVNDGINEVGVAFQQNVLQLGNEVTSGTNPDGTDTISLVVGRIVLDNAHSVDEAVELIKGLNIYATYGDLLTEEYHWLISDKEKSVVVEAVDNEIVVTETKIITNFYLNSMYFDGTVDSLKENQPAAMGWRRYFILKEGLEDVNSVEAMFNHMSKVFYSHAYDAADENYWYDEGYGLYDFDGDGEYEYFDMLNEADDNPVCKAYKDYYCGLGYMQELDNGTWFTAHTSIFDLDKKEMTVVVDEKAFDTAVTFGFDF